MFSHLTKGQIKLKADWRVIDSPNKRTNERMNERICFVFALQYGNT